MDMSNENSCGRAHCNAESRVSCSNYADERVEILEEESKRTRGQDI